MAEILVTNLMRLLNRKKEDPVISAFFNPTQTESEIYALDLQALKEQGLDYEFQFTLLLKTLQTIRVARSFINHGENPTLNQQLCDLTNQASFANGELFLTKRLSSADARVKNLYLTLTNILNLTRPNSKDYTQTARWATYGVFHTFNDFLLAYHRKGPSNEDSLGLHFPKDQQAHIFFDKISLSDIARVIRSGETSEVVIAAAASSGVLEAGIVAAYLKKEKRLPARVDALFFSKTKEATVVSSNSLLKKNIQEQQSWLHRLCNFTLLPDQVRSIVIPVLSKLGNRSLGIILNSNRKFDLIFKLVNTKSTCCLRF